MAGSHIRAYMERKRREYLQRLVRVRANEGNNTVSGASEIKLNLSLLSLNTFNDGAG